MLREHYLISNPEWTHEGYLLDSPLAVERDRGNHHNAPDPDDEMNR